MKNTNEAEKNIGKTLLIRLNSLDKGERSVLRRTVGRSLSQIDVRALETAFRVMPDDRQTELRQSAWLLALGVGSLWDAGIVHKTALQPSLKIPEAYSFQNSGCPSHRAVRITADIF